MARRQFKLPDVGEGLTDGEILTWFVAVGEYVSTNQRLVEIETAKAAVELPSPYEGVVVELLAAPGDVVDVGAPIITIETEPGAPGPATPEPNAPASIATAAVADAMGGEEPQVAAGLIGGEAPGGRTAVLVGYGPRTTAAVRRPRRVSQAAHHAPVAIEAEIPAGPLGTEDVKPMRHGGLEVGRLTEAREAPHAGEAVSALTIEVQGAPRVTVLAKPPVRKMAKDLGVDLSTITPTGPGGTITRNDVAARAGMASERPVSAAVAAAGDKVSAVDAAHRLREERVAVRGVRKMTAQAMVDSAFTAPHVTEFLTIDATRTTEFVERLRAHRSMEGLKVSPLLIVAKAVCLAARRTPECNASWDEAAQEIVLKSYVNLGIAAATPRGLLVPNIKGADDLTLPQLAHALGELAATAKAGRTPPADMAGGTVTITNVGVFGVDAGTPIINPGESAILCVGAIKAQPWVVDGVVVPRQVTTLSLSFDHRIVDGEAGSRFLVDVASVLEDPAAALLF
ncbi:MAG: dihydrolipoamide acetyltransferase family protein [Sporichthyaceae bacterium]